VTRTTTTADPAPDQVRPRSGAVKISPAAPGGPSRSAVAGEERDDLADRPPTGGADLKRDAPGLKDEEATDEGSVGGRRRR
jgi:hypothetical protein